MLLICVALFASSGFAFEPYHNAQMGYTISLPQHWALDEVSSERHVFYDTSGTYKSQISIMRYGYSPDEYATSSEWVRVQYIAYLFSVLYSANPVGSVIFGDTSSVVKQGELPAAELYARFCYLDEPLIWWDEYTRFAANQSFGYEMYVIGDTTDVASNILIYSAILESVELKSGPGANIRFALPHRQRNDAERFNSYLFDLRGRRIAAFNDEHRLPAGFYYRKKHHGNGQAELHLFGGQGTKPVPQN